MYTFRNTMKGEKFMSEKQAKLKRKAAQPEEIKKEKNPKKVIATIAMIVIAAAIAGTGGYASWQKIKDSLPASSATDTAAADTQTAATVATIAEQNGMTAEELLKKCGMEDSGLTAESSADEFSQKLTVAGYAGMEDKSADELKKEYGLENEPDDELWSEAMMKVKMSKIAEQNSSSFEDFAKNNGLPEGITADTTYGEAMTIMQNAQNADNSGDAENKSE